MGGVSGNGRRGGGVTARVRSFLQTDRRIVIFDIDKEIKWRLVLKSQKRQRNVIFSEDVCGQLT